MTAVLIVLGAWVLGSFGLAWALGTSIRAMHGPDTRADLIDPAPELHTDLEDAA